jgi:hypothetical protein
LAYNHHLVDDFDCRKYTDRGDYTRYVQGHSIDGKEYDYHSGPKLYEEDEAFTRRMEEEQALELERRCLAELQMADAKRHHAEVEASMAVIAAQNRSLVTAGFSSNDLSLPGEGTQLQGSQLDMLVVRI